MGHHEMNLIIILFDLLAKVLCFSIIEIFSNHLVCVFKLVYELLTAV
jgi:hypothetical protein